MTHALEVRGVDDPLDLEIVRGRAESDESVNHYYLLVHFVGCSC